MSAVSLIPVTAKLPAATLKGPSLVHVMEVTLEMGLHAMVSVFKRCFEIVGNNNYISKFFSILAYYKFILKYHFRGRF